MNASLSLQVLETGLEDFCKIMSKVDKTFYSNNQFEELASTFPSYLCILPKIFGMTVL